jgi:Zn-dependent protease
MRWSWKIGRIAGIDVYVHVTFLILLLWVAASQYIRERNVLAAASGLGFILTLFAIIVLHELGHALTARRYGIRTRDITLLPIGGVARLERMPDDPMQELLVALAGPAVNVVLAAMLLAVIAITGANVGAVTASGGFFLARLFWVNVALVVFNMIPAFPMDGGRVLRALLAMRMDYVRATHIAAAIGQAIAFLFGFLGLFYNPFLVFIALFVWIGAAQEATLVQMKYALGNIPISQAMITDFRTLSVDDNLDAAIHHILAGFQQDFPVVEEGRLVGVLTRNDLLTALAQQGPEMPVREVMQRNLETADPQEMLDRVFSRLQENERQTMPVVRGGRLVGLVTADNLGEFLMLANARNHRGQGWPAMP